MMTDLHGDLCSVCLITEVIDDVQLNSVHSFGGEGMSGRVDRAHGDCGQVSPIVRVGEGLAA